MFSIDEYLNKEWNDEILTDKITLRGKETEIRYRLLDGVDTLEATSKENLGERAVCILGMTVYDGDSNNVIGEKQARLFVNLYAQQAWELAVKIFNQSSERLELENKVFEGEVKNSDETNTPDSIGDTVNATV